MRFTFLLIVAIAGCEAPRADPTRGVSLVYEIKSMSDDTYIEKQGSGVKQRIELLGIKDVIVRLHGNKRLEIITPEIPSARLDQVKAAVIGRGVLQFRILANPIDHEDLLRLADDQTDTDRWVIDDQESRIGFWADVGCGPDKHGGHLKVDVSRDVIRDPNTKKLLSPPSDIDDADKFSQWLKEDGVVGKDQQPRVQVLMWTDDGYDVTAEHLSRIHKRPDERGNPSVSFTMTGKGSRLMEALTGEHLPEPPDHTRRLGIMLFNELMSAPTIRGIITTDGEITGDFTDEEIDHLVRILRAAQDAALWELKLASVRHFGPPTAETSSPEKTIPAPTSP